MAYSCHGGIIPSSSAPWCPASLSCCSFSITSCLPPLPHKLRVLLVFCGFFPFFELTALSTVPRRALAVAEHSQGNVFPLCEGPLLIPEQKAHLWRRRAHACLFQSVPSPFQGSRKWGGEQETPRQGGVCKNPNKTQRDFQESCKGAGGGRAAEDGGVASPQGAPFGMMCGGPSALGGAGIMQRKRLCNGVA